MVTKGLDFDNVRVVGIMSADNMLSFPDFRSHERSYQLMAQVSGRSGRKEKRGRVIIQTFQPKHPVIEFVVNNDHKGIYSYLKDDRLKFRYPPFYRLIIVKVKHRDFMTVNDASKVLAADIRGSFGKRVLGPEFPLVARIKNLFIKHILIKIEKDISLQAAKAELVKQIKGFQKAKTFKGVQVIVDVDPL